MVFKKLCALVLWKEIDFALELDLGIVFTNTTTYAHTVFAIYTFAV